MSLVAGKSVAILGAGRSGQAAARFASTLPAAHRPRDLTLYDANLFDFHQPGVRCVAKATEAQGLAFRGELVVLSPGIETGSAFVQSFLENGASLIGEIELASQYYQGKTVGITGTNGKTTTTELVTQLLKACGHDCWSAGNHGLPFCEALSAPDTPSHLSLELSSFQLETTTSYRPEVSVWLNFSADHLDRYPSLQAYRAAKERIFTYRRDGDPIVARAGESLPVPAADLTTFSAEREADWTLEQQTIQRHRRPYLSLSQTRLHGRHNAENIMAACAAVEKLADLTPEKAQEALADYAPPKHRCELIRTLDGVFYLNDSKATNLHALSSALSAQDAPLVLLLGGKEKGLDYAPLLPLLKGKVRAVFAFGEIGPSLHHLLSPHLPSTLCTDLEEAIPLAKEIAQPGDYVLLSPGTSSFDQYPGYEARGDHFRNLVLNLT